jgi:urease accessory protein
MLLWLTSNHPGLTARKLLRRARQTGDTALTLLRMTVGLFVAVAATPVLAHSGGAAPDLADAGHGLAAGFVHPFSGADHVLAMAAVGLWAGFVGGRAILAWPLAFLAVMALGAALGLGGLSLPAVEAAMALSVVVLGLAAALKAPLPVAAGAAVCGAFALFHGMAHGAELPAAAAAVTYGIGLMLATALLHAAGIGAALALACPAWLPRAAGAAVAATGLALLLG